MKTDAVQRAPGTQSQTLKVMPHAGHRERLRMRFLRGGLESMLDYEVLELLLSIVIPRRDVKSIAKELLAKFGSVSDALAAPREKLLEVGGIGETVATQLAIMNALGGYTLEEQCRQLGSIYDNPDLLHRFVRMKLGARPHESYMMIFLDTKKRIIDFRIIAEGTVDHVFAYVRNSAEYALELHATAAVMVHNHPSGDCQPSPEDVTVTQEMAKSLRTVGVELVDHLIVTRNDFSSFVRLGYLGQKQNENAEKGAENGANEK